LVTSSELRNAFSHDADDFEGITVGEPARVTPELFKVSEAMTILSMSRTVIYEQMRGGRLRYVKQGRATLITKAAIHEYIALLEQEAGVRYDETA
jgi:excisionase family DNA binding protein